MWHGGHLFITGNSGLLPVGDAVGFSHETGETMTAAGLLNGRVFQLRSKEGHIGVFLPASEQEQNQKPLNP